MSSNQEPMDMKTADEQRGVFCVITCAAGADAPTVERHYTGTHYTTAGLGNGSARDITIWDGDKPVAEFASGQWAGIWREDAIVPMRQADPGQWPPRTPAHEIPDMLRSRSPRPSPAQEQTAWQPAADPRPRDDRTQVLRPGEP